MNKDERRALEEEVLDHLKAALDTGVGGQVRSAIEHVISLCGEASRKEPSALKYQKLKPGERLADPTRPGLIMTVGRRTGKKWLYRTKHPETKKTVYVEIGLYPAVSVERARDLWHQMRTERRSGLMPRDSRTAGVWSEDGHPLLVRWGDTPIGAEPDDLSGLKMRSLVRRYLGEYAEKVKRSWKRDHELLGKHVMQSYGDTLIEEFDHAKVAAILKALTDRQAFREAEKVLAVVRGMFNVAIGKQAKIEMLRGSWLPPDWLNPTNAIVLPKRKAVAHTPDERELRNYIRNLSEVPHSDVLSLQIQTMSRIAEVAELPWSEIDLVAGTWVLSDKRAKNGHQHKVMLSSQSLSLLRNLAALNEEGSPYVFPRPSDCNQPIDPTTVSKSISGHRETLGVASGFKSHTVRHAAITWMAEKGIAREVRDRCTNHKTSAGTDAIYNAAELDGPSREAVQRWCNYLTALEADNVVGLERRL